MLFLVGQIEISKIKKDLEIDRMVLTPPSMVFPDAKAAIIYADEIGKAFVVQLKAGGPPNLIYETDDYLCR